MSFKKWPRSNDSKRKSVAKRNRMRGLLASASSPRPVLRDGTSDLADSASRRIPMRSREVNEVRTT